MYLQPGHNHHNTMPSGGGGGGGEEGSLLPSWCVTSISSSSSSRNRPRYCSRSSSSSIQPSSGQDEVSETTMQLTQLNRECLLHVFSFLDRPGRRSLSLTCRALRHVYLEPSLWTLLRFSSPQQLKLRGGSRGRGGGGDDGGPDYVLGPSLRVLAVCWHSSRVQQCCNVEEWLKSAFQRNVCSKHQGLVSAFLSRVCHTCPNLRSLTLSGCGHITDEDVVGVLRACPKLRLLHLENCVRVTDGALRALAAPDSGLERLEEVRVDYCRNVTQAGLSAVRQARPDVRLSAVRSGDMLPDVSKPPEEEEGGRRRRGGQQQRRTLLTKVLLFS